MLLTFLMVCFYIQLTSINAGGKKSVPLKNTFYWRVETLWCLYRLHAPYLSAAALMQLFVKVMLLAFFQALHFNILLFFAKVLSEPHY